MPSNEVVLRALSQITGRIKPGFGVSLMPHEFIDPARVAEKVATVDLISGGRVQWGLGRSTPIKQQAFGVDIARSKEKMCAAARTVVGMWAEQLKWEFSHLDPELQKAAFPLLDKQARGDFDITTFDKEHMVIVGTPDECLQKFLKYEEVGVDQLLCYINFGYLPHEAVMRSIELLGTFVIPELARRGASNAAASLDQAVR